MIEFTHSNKLAKIDVTKMDKFIAIFNKEIDKAVADETTGIVGINKNTTLDNIPSNAGLKDRYQKAFASIQT